MSDRQSSVDISEDEDKLIFNHDQVAEREARNGLLQFDEVSRLVAEFTSSKKFVLQSSTIQDLNRIAIDGIRRCAGSYRLVPISITNTPHTPPDHESVPELVDEMCSYVNAHWSNRQDDLEDALHIAAYVMWRLNWIHPFRDGNGRTSRAVSYLLLSIRLGSELSGVPTVADQIADDKTAYYLALDAADEAWRNGHVDVAQMERLLRNLLIAQLKST